MDVGFCRVYMMHCAVQSMYHCWHDMGHMGSCQNILTSVWKHSIRRVLQGSACSELRYQSHTVLKPNKICFRCLYPVLPRHGQKCPP